MEITELKIRSCGANHLVASREIEGVKHVKTLPFLSIVQSADGSYTIGIDGSPLAETGKGGIFVAAAGAVQDITHHVDPESGRMEMRWVFFDVTINGTFDMDYLFDYPVIAPEPLRARLDGLLDEYFAADNDCAKIAALAKAAGSLMEFSRRKNMAIDENMLAVAAYMKAHCADDLDIGKLALTAHMSKSNFHAAFKKSFGKPAIAYLNDYRLSVASDLLLRTTLSVGEIAERVGITDQLYFSRIFRKKYLLSPLQYRKTTKT